MSAPVIHDPAVTAISVVIDSLADAFDPASSFPPEHGSRQVRFFAGEAPATATFNAHSDQAGCDEPFLWVRVMRRYRTKILPNSEATSNACDLPRAVDVEVGVARCAVVDQEPTWEDYDAEAATSLEDSWRIERAVHVAQCRLRADNYIAAAAELVPFGPIGGIIGWQCVVYIQFD